MLWNCSALFLNAPSKVSFESVDLQLALARRDAGAGGNVMSDLKLFRTGSNGVSEIDGTAAALEKSLQTLIESNLETFLGVRFLASEFSTGREHGGRMDTLGLDENGCPVIIEYKRATNMNVINQGLFYLDWLVTHRGDFEMLVLKSFGQEAAQSVEWTNPRLICIAGDFSKYDEHAIKQMNHNIELIRYMRFGDDLLLLEQVNAVSVPSIRRAFISTDGADSDIKYVENKLAQADQGLADLFQMVRAYLESLGDDVQFKTLKHYFAFKRIKNFVCISVFPQNKNLLAHASLDPTTIILEEGFTRDVTDLGHFGTGRVEITLRTVEDFEKAKPLLERSYESA